MVKYVDFIPFTKPSSSLPTYNPSHFLIRRQMEQDTCLPWCNEASVFTYNCP